MQLLSKEQKAAVAKAARRAYDAWEGREEFELCNDHLSRTACFEAWRHVEIGKVTGGRSQSLRECVSEVDFLPLLAHFRHMAGDGGGALSALLRHAEEGRITAFFKLEQALAERGLDEGYVAAICRRQYKCALGDASEKQLWSLFFTVRNRRKVAANNKQKPAPRKIETRTGTLSVDTLRTRMAAAVKAENYELAAQIRDQIAAGAQSAANPF